jgi:hypothetical protein
VIQYPYLEILVFDQKRIDTNDPLNDHYEETVRELLSRGVIVNTGIKEDTP